MSWILIGCLVGVAVFMGLIFRSAPPPKKSKDQDWDDFKYFGGDN